MRTYSQCACTNPLRMHVFCFT